MVVTPVANPTHAPALLRFAAAVTARNLGVDIVASSNREDPTMTQLARKVLGTGTVQHDARRRSVPVAELARPDDLVILPAMGDRAHVRALARRVLPALPDGAGMVAAFNTSHILAAGPARLIGEPSRTETPGDPMTLSGEARD